MLSQILLLGALSKGARHGYDINKSIEHALGSGYGLNANSLYPLLRRFLADGLVTREVLPQPGKPDRHVYSLTPAGAQALRDLLLDYPDQIAGRDSEFRARLICFELLSPEERKSITDRRRAALRNLLKQYYERRWNQESPYAARVVDLTLSLCAEELRWLDTLSPNHVETKSNRPSGKD